MARPQYQIRGGEAYVLHDGEDDTFHFVYMEPTQDGWALGRWMHDRWTPDAIRNGSMRFYRFVDPPPWYRAHAFATVGDDAIFAQFNIIENNELLESIRNTGAAGIQRARLRSASSPPDEDRAFREQRDGIQAVGPGQPPQPPGGGPVAEEGAESQQGRGEAQRAAALPALAAALLAFPAAVDAPAVEANEHAPPDMGAASAALRLLAALTGEYNEERRENINWRRWGAEGPWGAGGYGVHRPANLEIPIYNNIVNDFYDDIRPLAAAQPLPKPQKRVAEIVIADAVKNAMCCPITMDPIKADSAACVAPCYHVFEKEAIKEWLGGHDTCPQCRESCAL